MSDFDPVPGLATQLGPGLRRVLAPNPSPMTFRGTNTYLLGDGDVAVIDPGPADPRHLEALLGALRAGERISHVFVTHAHRDHSALAPALAAATGATVLAFGEARAGRSPVMQRLAAAGEIGGGEGVDSDFHPDRMLREGEVVGAPTWSLQAFWTPGHMSSHMVFRCDDAVFSGDLVMGWSTSIVSPPDGEVAAFLASCRRLAGTGIAVFHPGHGAPVTTPDARLRQLIDHRLDRERQICEVLAAGPRDLTGLTEAVYPPLAAGVAAAARRSVFAHLIDLAERGLVRAEPALSQHARFVAADRDKPLPA